MILYAYTVNYTTKLSKTMILAVFCCVLIKNTKQKETAGIYYFLAPKYVSSGVTPALTNGY